MKSDTVRSEMEKRVSEILFYVWDPIGVNRMTSCRDEYESYVPVIAAYLLHDFAESALDTLMMFIMEDYMGTRLTSQPRRKYQHIETMRMLMEWRNELLSKYSDLEFSAPNLPKKEPFLNQINWSRHQLYSKQ